MNKIIDTLKNTFSNVKNISLSMSSIFFLRTTIILLIIPIINIVCLQLFITISGIDSELAFRLIDSGIRITDHIWSVPVVTGVLSFAKGWVDRNQDGVPDIDEEENK